MERFVQPVMGEEYPSEYDFPSNLLADLISRQVQPCFVKTIDLSTAGQIEIGVPGRWFVPYGYTTTDAVKGVQDILINVRKEDTSAPIFPAKHNRGQSGLFTKLILSWAAQSGLSCDFVILKSDRKAWMMDFNPAGSAGTGLNQLTGDVTAGPGTGSQVATLATVNAAPGTYTNATVTVNAKGLVTLASAGAAGNTPAQEVPSGAINNSNVTFTLANTPASVANLLVYLDGKILRQGIGLDYTISGVTITMTVAPNFAQELYASYYY